MKTLATFLVCPLGLVALVAGPIRAQPAGMPPAPSVMGPALTSGPRSAPPAQAPGQGASGLPSPSAADALKSQLSIQRVVREGGDNAKGPERFEPVTSQSPGDLIQVNVQYTNMADRTVTGTDMTLPIPPGTTFVPRSVKEKGWLGSKDGTTFTPLLGTDADKSARQLRLRVEQIPPRKVGAFTFRVRVDGQAATSSIVVPGPAMPPPAPPAPQP